jgi:Nitric oxide reductase activation protein
MSDEALRRILARIGAEKPQLTKHFADYVEAASALGAVDDAALEALCELAYATEFLYAEPRRLVSLLVSRGELKSFSCLLYALGRFDYGCAKVLLDAYPRLRLSIDSIEADLRGLARSCASAKDGCREALALCLAAGDPDDCRFFLSRFAVVARYAPGALRDIARAASSAGDVTRSSREEMRRWIGRGADLASSGRVDEGVRLLLLESSAGRRMLGIRRVFLSEERNVLRIYATSLAGRDLAINSIELSMFRLKAPYTDGSSLFLPPEISYFGDEELNRRAYAALAALQAANVGMGSFGLDLDAIGFKLELRERYGDKLPSIMENLRRQYEGVAEELRERRDGEVEAVFPGNRRLLLLNTEHEKLFFSLPTPDFARELFGLVENARVEARLGDCYPGLKKDFALVNAYLWKRRLARYAPDSRGPEFRGFFATLEATIQYSLLGRWSVALEDSRESERIDRITRAFDAVRAAGASVQDSASAMFEIYNLFFDGFRLELICRRFDLRMSFGESGKPRLYPEVVLSVRPDLLKASVKSDFVGEEAEKKGKAIDFSSFRQASAGEENLRKAIESKRVKVYRYREYDFLRGSYLPNRCTLFEMQPPSPSKDKGDAVSFYDEVLRRNAQVHKRTRKRFLAMKPEETELSRGWYSGGEINVSDAVDYCTSLRRGESPDEKIYCQKILNRRDLAACVLLDASNSTDAQVSGRRVIDIEKDSLVLLAAALDAIGDPFALYSFNSSGPGKVYFSIVKDFAEPWAAEARGRVGLIEPYESNRDGCAIRHASARLASRPERTKLLLLLSDGIPADVDYGADAGMNASDYAIEDTRRAIIEARELGITPFCLNVDRQAKDYIGRLYGAHRYALLDEVARLPEQLSKLYLRLTG